MFKKGAVSPSTTKKVRHLTITNVLLTSCFGVFIKEEHPFFVQLPVHKKEVLYQP